MEKCKYDTTACGNLRLSCFSVLSLAFVFLLVLQIARAGTSAAKTVEDLAFGPPANQGTLLPTESYIPFQVCKLAHPRVLWVNWDLLQKMGVRVPLEGLTAQFEKEILNAVGYAVPSPRDPPSAFGPETKTVWTDRYGGSLIGFNFGGGRTGISGQLQAKGIGQTPAIGYQQSQKHGDHASGRGSLEELMRDAEWGELWNEAPHGGNRVLFLLDPGLKTIWPDGGQEINAISIRVDAIRDAHYLRVDHNDPNPLLQTEDERVRKAQSYMVRALTNPKAPIRSPRLKDLEPGFIAKAERVAEQYAFLRANRWYHGSTSESNIEITGALLDSGTMTSQPSYGRIQIIPYTEPAGDTQELKSKFSAALIDGLPQVSESIGFSKDEVKTRVLKRFDERYHSALQRNFLELAGIPHNIIEKLESTAQHSVLADLLHQVAIADAVTVNVDKHMPAQLTRYDLKTILPKLAFMVADGTNVNAIKQSLTENLLDATIGNELIDSFEAYLKLALPLAHEDGVSERSFFHLIAQQAAMRNSAQPQLERRALMHRNQQAIQNYIATGNRTAIWDTIDDVVQGSRRIYRNNDPYQLVLAENRFPIPRRTERYIYDARKAQHQVILSMEPVDGKIEFPGNLIDLEDASQLVARYSTDGWKTWQEANVVQQDGGIEFVLPVEGRGRNVELALRSRDGSRWWKQDGRNVTVVFKNFTPERTANCILYTVLDLLNAPSQKPAAGNF